MRRRFKGKTHNHPMEHPQIKRISGSALATDINALINRFHFRFRLIRTGLFKSTLWIRFGCWIALAGVWLNGLDVDVD